MTDIIVVLVVFAVLGFAITYIVRAKKSGVKCIGCPAGGNCTHSHGADSCCNCNGGESCHGCNTNA